MFEVHAVGHPLKHEVIFRTTDLEEAREEYKKLRQAGFHLVSLRMVPGTWDRGNKS